MLVPQRVPCLYLLSQIHTLLSLKFTQRVSLSLCKETHLVSVTFTCLCSTTRQHSQFSTKWPPRGALCSSLFDPDQETRAKGDSGLEPSRAAPPGRVYPLGQMVAQRCCAGMKHFQQGRFSLTALYKCKHSRARLAKVQLLLNPTFPAWALFPSGMHILENTIVKEIISMLRFWSGQASNWFCFSGLQEDAPKPAPARNQMLTKAEPLPGITKSPSFPGAQAGPALVPHRPPPKVPTTKKPAPLQRTGVKMENVSCSQSHPAFVTQGEDGERGGLLKFLGTLLYKVYPVLSQRALKWFCALQALRA